MGKFNARGIAVNYGLTSHPTRGSEGSYYNNYHKLQAAVSSIWPDTVVGF